MPYQRKYLPRTVGVQISHQRTVDNIYVQRIQNAHARMLVNRNIKQGSRVTRWAMGAYAPDLLRVPFQATMTEPQIRAGDDGLDQTPPPLVAGSLQLLRVGHR